MSERLKGKVAIVTGASTGMGIGRASAEMFAAEGARVVVNDIAKESGEVIAQGIIKKGGWAHVVAGDPSKEDDAQHIVKAALDTCGKIDILFNATGGTFGGRLPLVDTPKEDWDRIVEFNLSSVFLMSKCVIPHMIANGGGVILNLGGTSAVVGTPSMAAYCAAKAAVANLTRQMAVDYGPYNIRVNILCPGTLESPMILDMLQSSPDPDKARRDKMEASLLGRLGKLEDATYAAVYLVSDEATFVTGGVFMVDGGLTAR